MEYVVLACRVLVGIVFLVSAAGKLRTAFAFRLFVNSARDMGVPRSLALPIAIGVVVGEGGAVALLAFWPGGTAGFAVAGVLLTGFTVGIAGVLRREKAVSCACFGTSATPIGPRHLVRNGVLLAVVAAGLLCHLLPAVGHVEFAGALSAAFAGLVGALLVVFTDDLASLFAAPERPAARGPDSSRAGRGAR